MKEEPFGENFKQFFARKKKAFLAEKNLIEKCVVHPYLACFFIVAAILYTKFSVLVQNILFGCWCVWVIFYTIRLIQWCRYPKPAQPPPKNVP